MNAVNRPGVPEKNFAAWSESGCPTLHIRNPARRRLAFKRRQPEAGLSLRIVSFQHDLLIVRRDVIVECLKTWYQPLGTSGIDLRYPQFTRLLGELKITQCFLH